jgi:hypothetical protein
MATFSIAILKKEALILGKAFGRGSKLLKRATYGVLVMVQISVFGMIPGFLARRQGELRPEGETLS